MIFFKKFIGEYEMNVAGHIRQRIMQMSKSQVESDQDLESLKNSYQFGTLVVDWEGLTALPNVKEVKTQRGGLFGVEEVLIPVYGFELPYEGDERLFSYHGDQNKMWNFEADVQEGKIHFEIQGADKAKLDSIKQNFSFDLEHLVKHVPIINNVVSDAFDKARKERLKQLESSQDGLNTFGVPVKGSE